MVQFPSVYGILRYTLFGRARRYVDLDEHSWPSECSYDEKRAGRLGRTVAPCFSNSRLILSQA